MEVLENFGFDPVMLVAQIINFLIILFLLKRFLYKPIFKIIKERQEKIEEGIKQAEKARKTLDEAIEKETKILSLAKSEAQKIIDDAKTDSLELAKQIQENAKLETKKLIDDAMVRIALESELAEKKLSQHTADLARELLINSLQGIIDKSQQKKIVQNVLNKINKK